MGISTNTNINNNNSKVTSSINIKRLIAIVLITIAIIFIIVAAMKDISTFYVNTYAYIIVVTLLLLGILLYFTYSFPSNDQVQILTILVVSCFFIFFIWIAIITTNNLSLFNIFTPNLLLNLLLICILLLALAIIFFIFLSKYASHGTWGSFIVNFIFYIPCLFSDIFTYLLKDFITTPKSVFHLLFLELVFIIIYFYFYPKIQQTTINNGVVLVTNPIMLNIKTRIDGPLYQTFFNKTNDPITNTVTISSPLRSTFSIGMWIFLNIQSSSQLTYTKELNLFDYSGPKYHNQQRDKSNLNSHPKVTYLNNSMGLDEYIFYLAPDTENLKPIKYSKSLPHQKWNYLVFNYRDGAVDIFINGEFETSVNIPKPIEYTNQDIISIGQYDLEGKDRSGIYGSICNVVYYKNILPKTQIISNYNLLNIKTPPV